MNRQTEIVPYRTVKYDGGDGVIREANLRQLRFIDGLPLANTSLANLNTEGKAELSIVTELRERLYRLSPFGKESIASKGGFRTDNDGIVRPYPSSYFELDISMKEGDHLEDLQKFVEQKLC